MRTEDVASMLHGRWEYTGRYKESVFEPDTISRASGNRAGENYRLYNILSDSGIYQHLYTDNNVRFIKSPRPFVVEYDTQIENYTAFGHFFDPESDYTTEKKMLQSYFSIEIKDKPNIVYGVFKVPILEISNDKLIIQYKGYSKHYKKHGNSL